MKSMEDLKYQISINRIVIIKRKQLLHLFIDEIIIDRNKDVEGIWIKISTEVAKYLLTTEAEKSSYLDDFSASFCVYLLLW